jgi:hypothetical protein
VIRFSDRVRGLVLVLCLCLAPAAVHAQTEPAPSDPKEMARSQGAEALALHAAGKFQDAYAKFETAERIAHSPVFVVWMARSKRALGELLAAKRLYQRVASEVLPADASPNWKQAKQEAEAELAALSARMPSIEVQLAASSPPGVVVDLDGRAISAGTVVEVDPGEHVVRVTAGATTETRTVRVDEGQPREVVRFEMRDPSTKPDPTESTEGSLVPGAVVLGVGIASLVAGVVTGAYALVLAGEVNENCIGNRCLASDQDKADDADALARASTGTLIAGGVVGAVGVVLLVVRPGGSSTASVRAGPTWAALEWRF